MFDLWCWRREGAVINLYFRQAGHSLGFRLARKAFLVEAAGVGNTARIRKAMMAERLSAGRVSLTPVTEDDSAAFQQVMAGPDMGHHTDVPAQPTPKQAAQFVRWMAGLNSSGRGRAWAISLTTGEPGPVGFIRLNRIEKRASIGKIGYEVAQPQWGRGIAQAALRCVVQHAHQDLDLYRLEAWVLSGNEASARVLKAAGFTHEGTEREKMVLRGQRRDAWTYGRLSADPFPG